MSVERFTSGRWAVLPQITPVRTPHHCAGDDCPSCARAIDAAEDEREFGGEHDQDMDDRAEREASRW